MLELREINKENYVECLQLNTKESNVDFVDSVAWSLAEAWVDYNVSYPFAIYANNEMVGFVSMFIGDNNHQIINFLIDSRFQNRGYGTAAVALCIEYLCKEHSAKRISVPVHLEHHAAQKFWRKQGFEPSDTIENGYLFVRKHISN